MSFCPRPDATSVTNYSTTSTNPTPITVSPGTPGTKTVNPPAPRNESCGASTSTVVTGAGAVNPPPPTGNSGTSTTVTTQVPGPAGPMGKGFIWKGDWTISENYRAQSDDNPLADVVFYNGSSWIAINDNISNSSTDPESEPGVSGDWQLVAQVGQLPPTEKSFIDSLKDDVFDWVKHASVTDLILAGLGVAGIVWAGSKIISAIAGNGNGDGNADSRYSGSPGYLLSSYVAPDIKDVITSLCAYANIPCDVSALPNQPCEFTIGDLTSIRSILTTLSQTFLFDMIDTNGTLKFIPRQVSAVKTIDKSDMGFSTSKTPITPYSGKRLQGISLPKSIALTYYDASLDYNQFTQTAQLFTYPDGQEVTLSVPVTLTAAQAKKVAEVALINSHLEATSYSFFTSYKHIDLEPGDVVSSPMGLIRITKIQEGDEGILQFDATDAGGELAVQGSNLQPTIPPASTNIPLTIGYSQAFFIDPPNLDDQDTGVRLYAAVHGYGKTGWPGANIYHSEDNGATYDIVGTATSEATFGIVETATPAADWHFTDNTTSITVKLKTGSLLSTSTLGMLNGQNRCMIGQEVIDFKNATLVADKTYVLTGLLRGRQGTEQYISTHVDNELFVMLDSSLVRIDLPDADRNTTKKYKVVTLGSDISKADSEDVHCISNNTLMYPVFGAKILKTGSDFVVSYNERIRFDNQLKDYATAIHDPDWAGYGIIIYADSSYTTPKARYTTTSTSWTYSLNMQNTDFGAAQNHLYVRVSQLSKKWGAGYPVTLNI